MTKHIAIRDWKELKNGFTHKGYNNKTSRVINGVKLDSDNERVIVECEAHQKTFQIKASTLDTITCWLVCICTDTPWSHYKYMQDRPMEKCNGENGCMEYMNGSTRCEKWRNNPISDKNYISENFDHSY